MVDAVNSSGSYNTGTGNSALGKDDFMKLLLTQMKYQDPLEPLDSSEYAAQLANFSSLEQMQNMNDMLSQSIDANYYLTQSINNTMSATLIGKDVKLSGNDIIYQGQDEIGFGYTLPADAASVEVKIYNKNGTLVKEFENVEKNAGEHKLLWDFTDNNGSNLQEGNYTFEITAKSYKGDKLKIESYKYGTIDGIKFGDSGTMMVVGDVKYLLSDIMEIVNSDNSSDG